MRECSRNCPITERTRIFALSPLIPGRSAHIPRIIRSISTPAHDASYSASIVSRSSSAFILAMIAAGFPALAFAVSRRISPSTSSASPIGATINGRYGSSAFEVR